MKVSWSPVAEDSLEQIRTYLRGFSEGSAKTWSDQITERADSLGEYPWRCRVIPEIGVARFREAFEKPYRIWFEIRTEDDEVEIMVIFHGSRDVP